MKETKTIITVKEKNIRIATLLYMYIPLIIWISTWTKFFYGIPVMAILIFVLYRMSKKVGKNREISFTKTDIIFILLFVAVLAWICGWGGFVAQCEDFKKHNAVLSDLATRAWPIYYWKEGVASRLTYYMGQYIVPGLIGKTFFHVFRLSENAAFYAASYSLLFWNVIGILIVICHIMLLLNNPKNKILYIVVFVAIGNFIPYLARLYSRLSGAEMSYIMAAGYAHQFDFGRLRLEYSTNFVLLRWVFQYVLPCWMVQSFYLENKDESEFIVIGLPLVLFAPFCLLGLIPFMVLTLLIDTVKQGVVESLKKCFSLENILVLISLSSFFLLYFKGFFGNPDKPDIMGIQTVRLISDVYAWRVYVFTIISSVLVFVLLCVIGMWKKKNVKWLYMLLAVGILLLLPKFIMGINNDLVSRASIPALFVISILLLQVLKEQRHSMLGKVIVIVCFLSCFGNIQEIGKIIKDTDWHVVHHEFCYPENTMEIHANPTFDLREDLKWNYYDYVLGDNVTVHVLT